MLVDRWIYRAHDLYPCYNTDQIFTDNSDGLSTVLPAYYKNNLGLIEYHKKQIQQLTNKKPKSVITDRQKYALSVVTLAILILAFVFMSVDRLTNFHPKLFSPAVASSKPSSLPSSIPISPVPAQNQSVNLVNTSASKVLPHSERWRVSAVVRNNVTKKYVVTVADRDGHMKTLREGVCVFDTHNQPSCAIDGEVIDLFTGAYSEEKKNDKQKLDVFATAVK
jgi:hypothetical protein